MKGCIDKKQQHLRFLLKTQEIASENLWSWLKQGCLKRRTEAFVMAAQEQAVRTNGFKAKAEKTLKNSKCSYCGKADETLSYVLKEYKGQHDRVEKKSNWDVFKKYGVAVKEKWYQAEALVENQ